MHYILSLHFYPDNIDLSIIDVYSASTSKHGVYYSDVCLVYFGSILGARCHR